LADFHRAKNRRLGMVAKNQGATVTCGQAKKFAFCFSAAELFRSPDNLPQDLQLRGLLVQEQLGITDDVDEQDMADLQPNFRFCLGGHLVMSDEPINNCASARCREQSWA